MGTANHTPVIPINCGIINKPIIIKPNVLKKEIKADSLPLDNAVKIADENILKPEKRKLNTNIINPFIAILYTASFVPVNKRTKVPAVIVAALMHKAAGYPVLAVVHAGNVTVHGSAPFCAAARSGVK